MNGKWMDAREEIIAEMAIAGVDLGAVGDGKGPGKKGKIRKRVWVSIVSKQVRPNQISDTSRTTYIPYADR